MLVYFALERTLVMSFVVAPNLLNELPEDFDDGALADFQARAVWSAICKLIERRESIHIDSVRAELEAWAGHRELHWFARPTPSGTFARTDAWPRALVDIFDLLAERLVVDPTSLPITGWARSLQRLAATRRALVELDEDIDVAAMERAAS